MDPDVRGHDTPRQPFKVYDAESLQRVGKDPDKGWTLAAHYILTQDINMAGLNGFQPIGNDSNEFTGTFDGNGNVIRNLVINNPSDNSQGLFGYISSTAVVENLGLVDGSVSGNYNAGGVVGVNDGIVRNCYATGRVNGAAQVGGVVGRNDGIVQNCYATGKVISPGNNVGGVVGENNIHGTVQNCFSTGDVSGYYYAGGVVGMNNGAGIDDYCIVENSYATGKVSGEAFAGGVVGGSSSGTVRNCYATGDVTGTGNPGSFVGGVVGAISAGAKVQNSYATGNVNGYNWVSGIAGRSGGRDLFTGAANIVQNCVALSQTITGNANIGCITGRSSSGASILSNNYARSDLEPTMTGGTRTPDKGPGESDGADVAAGTDGYNSQAFWAGLGWDFSSTWAWGSNGLPVLRKMP